jgi:branched-chain amino acid transport system ATP-binding protein
MAILNIQHLTKKFGGLIAVNDLSFEVETGEILGLIGPNGAGKTTVFSCISGFETPESGKIDFQGKSILKKLPFEICRLGMVRTFQIVKPFPAISVLDNVMVGALLRENSVAKAEKEAHRIIDFVGLKKMKDTEAKGLPLPLRKRLELARANGQGVSILMIEHVMRGVMALSHRVIVINYGQKIAEGKPDMVVQNEAVIEAYLGKEFINAKSA